ncbi:MAG: hypothetical protein H6920_07620 [Sphingomonadaceae bacterium]|nr:hypothetical protein [Altererythrobacter sp.]MCP5391471.1 hypothetical protein [Sphingomonadaceae bacterium]MCP5394408.1 hypothetical protein [Sphingomonadaceae bacterium]
MLGLMLPLLALQASTTSPGDANRLTGLTPDELIFVGTIESRLDARTKIIYPALWRARYANVRNCNVTFGERDVAAAFVGTLTQNYAYTSVEACPLLGRVRIHGNSIAEIDVGELQINVVFRGSFAALRDGYSENARSVRCPNDDLCVIRNNSGQDIILTRDGRQDTKVRFDPVVTRRFLDIEEF